MISCPTCKDKLTPVDSDLLEYNYECSTCCRAFVIKTSLASISVNEVVWVDNLNYTRD